MLQILAMLAILALLAIQVSLVAWDATTSHLPDRRTNTSVNRSRTVTADGPAVVAVVRPVTTAASPNTRTARSSISTDAIGVSPDLQVATACALVITSPVMWMTDQSGASIAAHPSQSPFL